MKLNKVLKLSCVVARVKCKTSYGTLPLASRNKKSICLDFDGVIANIGALKQKSAYELTGRRVTLAEASGERVRAGKSALSLQEWERIKEKVYLDADAIKRLKPVRDSIPTILAWLRKGYAVKVVTARTGQRRTDAKKWLTERGIDIPVIGVGAGKTKIAHLEKCDVFVDDDAHRVSEAVGVVGEALLFRWPYNDDEKGIRSIRSLKEI